MTIDKKYFTFAVLILLALLTAGIIQLSPPETPPDAPKFYFRNTLLTFDLYEKAVYLNVEDAFRYLYMELSTSNRTEELELWLKYRR